MKKNFLLILFICLAITVFAQKQSFDVISFSIPKSWQQKQFEGGVQYSITDKQTGGYAIALITKATASNAGANENFSIDWNKLVKAAVQVNGEPSMLDPTSDNGWEIISGTANYTDGNQNGVATLLTATGGNQMTSVLVMTNTSKYQEEIMAFISSLKLAKATQQVGTNSTPANPAGNNNSSVVGLWCHNLLETSGYANGYPQYTAGYFRREYLFKDDGTYVFRIKNWSAWMKEILFVYESGTYIVKGNQITISPNQGRGEWWSKKDNKTTLWGNRLKASNYKLEKTTYAFEIKYYSGSNDYALILNPNKTTERDGTYDSKNYFSYKKYTDGKSIIDNPPGFKTAVENKPAVSAANSSGNNSSNSNASIASSPNADANNNIAGLWIDYNPELAANPYNTNYAGARNSTGGYRNKEYQFFSDGTYLYRKKYWVTTMKEILYTYETGTYSLNGDQLTINPKKGKSEWWSKQGSQTNAWGKFVKAAEYKIENTTYNFSLIIDPNYSNSIVLKPAKPTERDGGQFNAANEPYEFHYHFRKMESLIDNPPGYPKQIKTN